MDEKKTRIVKAESARAQEKPGIITTIDDSGKARYKYNCERCGISVTTLRRPKKSDDSMCSDCYNIGRYAKESTRVFRFKGRKMFKTECDDCGNEERSAFMPNRDRPFLCNQCIRLQRNSAPPNPSQDDPHPQPQIEARPASFTVPCRGCRKMVTLKFKPDRWKKIFCPQCFTKRQPKPRPEGAPRTSVLTNIECSQCGRQETLNLIPTRRTEPICSQCLRDIKKRRRDEDNKNR